jgi:hypothetical protein
LKTCDHAIRASTPESKTLFFQPYVRRSHQSIGGGSEILQIWSLCIILSAAAAWLEIVRCVVVWSSASCLRTPTLSRRLTIMMTILTWRNPLPSERQAEHGQWIHTLRVPSRLSFFMRIASAFGETSGSRSRLVGLTGWSSPGILQRYSTKLDAENCL